MIERDLMMKFKISLVLSIFLSSCVLNASLAPDSAKDFVENGKASDFADAAPDGSAHTSSSSSSNFPFTPEQLVELKKKQCKAKNSTLQQIEIGTITTFHSEIYQKFAYGSVYKGIDLNNFFEKYTDVIEGLKKTAQKEFRVSVPVEDLIYTELAWNSNQRIVENYETTDVYVIVGEMPYQDALFATRKAKFYVDKEVKKYIHNNYDSVYAACVGEGLSTTTSSEVCRPCGCDLQIHKDCFQQCQKNKVKCCINLFCQQDATGKFQASEWTSDFYEQALAKNIKVKNKHVRDADCPICTEPLKPAITAPAATRSKNKRKIDDTLD